MRPRIRERIAALRPDWAARLGEDHVVKLDALAAISETALTRDVAIEIAENGLPTTFVPGRNLMFFAFAGALAYRRGAKHLVAGMCETDFSGYPDCRDDTIKAMQLALDARHGPALRHPYAADVDRQGGDLRAGRTSSAATPSSICWSRRPTPAISATARTATPGAMAAATCPACRLRADGFAKWKAAMLTRATSSKPDGAGARASLFLILFALTIPAANWLIGNAGTMCVPNGPCLIPVAPGLMAPSGVLMIGIALVLRDLVQRRLGVGVAVGAILVGAALSALVAPPALVIASAVGVPALRVRRPRGLYAAGAPPADRGRGRVEHGRARRRLDRVPLARLRLARLPGRAGRRQGLDGACSRSRSSPGCAAATSGSAWRRPERRRLQSQREVRR